MRCQVACSPVHAQVHYTWCTRISAHVSWPPGLRCTTVARRDEHSALLVLQKASKRTNDEHSRPLHGVLKQIH
eukprot:359346-Chlamydomonas_euryale.AAC.1